jgi:catalase
LVRVVLDDAARERLVGNIVGHHGDGVVEAILGRALDCWRNVDDYLGARAAKGLGA